jgi:carbon-monoxide dehydrogenase small subunit
LFSYSHRQSLQLTVNHDRVEVAPRPADTLLATLRGELGLTGVKPGCENGDCGACTVMIDGAPMKSCLMLTVEAEGRAITTVEGLNNTALQEAFIDAWAFQCGYCTSGFLLVSQALMETVPDASPDQIVEWLRSNICRCTGYQEITEAVETALHSGDPPS